MPTTNTRTDYIILYRTFAEMYENLDFIQTLERLKTGEPTNMHGSSVSGKIDGTNRPLARLAHSLDSILDQVMLLKTVSVEAAGGTYITWNGTNVVSNGTITVTLHLIAAGQISSAPSGKIEYSIPAFTKNMSSADWGYLILPMDPTGSTTVTVNIGTDADLQTQLTGPNRMKILPLFYKTSTGQIVWMLGGRQSIHQGFDYYPGTGQNRYYGKNTNVHALTSINISGSGNVAWIKNGATSGAYNLTLPTLVVTGPSISQTVSGATYTSGTSNDLQAGHALFIDTSSGSVSVESLNSSNFSNSDNLRAMVCARVGNDVYFWNGLKLIGTAGAGTGTTVDLFNFQQQLVRLVDDSTSFYLDILSNSDSNFSANRSLTLDTGDADRTLKLKGASTYTFNASSFSVEGAISTAVNSSLTLQDTCALNIQGTSSNPSTIALNQATIDLESGCSIDLNTTSSITASNSTLALGTGNAVSIGANLSTTAALTVSSICTLDQNLSTTSSPTFGSANLVRNGSQIPTVTFNKSNGTAGSPTNVSGTLLEIAGNGYNEHGSGSYEQGAFIKMPVTHNPDGSQANDVAAAIAFGTAAGSGVAVAEKMRLTADGNLGIGLTNPSSKVYVEGAVSSPLLTLKPDSYSKPVDFTLDNDGNLDIQTTGGAQVTINNDAVRVEEITVVVALGSSAVSANGMVIPTLDKATRTSPGTYVQDKGGSGVSNWADYGLTNSQDRASSVWVAPRACKVVGYRFASEVNFGSYDAVGELNDGSNNYPGFGASSSWSCPDDVKVDLRVVAFKLDPTPSSLLVGGFYTASATDIDYVGNAYQKFLYGAIFDSTNSLGTGATTGAGSSFYAYYAGREVSGNFVAPMDVAAGEALLIVLNDPSGTADSSPANQSFLSRFDTGGSSSNPSNPWVKITILIEYPV